jgi:hypothetical protein
MILSAESLEVLAYLKSCNGQYVTMGAISKQAGGRRRFEETPNWAKGLMGPLVEAGMLEMNERGHYRAKGAEPAAPTRTSLPRPPEKVQRKVVGDDYFPSVQECGVVGDNYFPQAAKDISSDGGGRPKS